MEELKRTNKLLVVADESGNIVSGLWPGIQSEGAPSETGISLSGNQVAHEMDVPDELYQAARPNLNDYYLQSGERGAAALVKRS